MKASELRIGNWLQSLDSGGYGSSTPFQIISGAQIDQCIKFGITPIPLTEEWLIKFGFTAHAVGDCFIKSYGPQGELIIFNWKTPVAVANEIKEGEYYYFFNRLVHTIKYVHQLQNLYFVLTEAELTLTK